MRFRLEWAWMAVLGTGVLVGCGGDGRECGEGTVAMGDRCVPASTVECGEGTVLDMNVCVPAEEPVTCGTGTTLNSATGTCEPNVTCGTGTVAMGRDCVPDGSVICTGNTVFDAATGTCVLDPDACAEGTVLVDGACVAYDDSLVADVNAGGEPDDATYDGMGVTFTPPAVGSRVTIRGCITPQDFDADGVLDADNDVFDFTVAAPGLYDIRIDGLNGLSAAYAVISPDEALEGWQRIALDLSNDGARRQIWLPRAGVYGLIVSDARSLLTNEPAGGENTCYFVTMEALPTPTPTALTATTRMGSDLGNPEFYTVATEGGDNAFYVQLEDESEAAAPAFVLAEGATFDKQAAETTAGPAANFSDVVTTGGSLTIVVDHVFNYATNPVPWTLTWNRIGEAEGTVSVPHVNETFSFLFFEGTAGDVVRFQHASAQPIQIQIINSAVTALLASICAAGAECDESDSWLQLTTTGRYIIRMYNPTGTAGTPYDVTFTRTAVTPTALTLGTASTLTLANGFAFASVDASGIEWGRVDLASFVGTGFTDATVSIFVRENEGSLELPGTGGALAPVDEATTDSSFSRIWIPAPSQLLIAVSDSAGFDGGEAVGLTFARQDYEAITLTVGTPVTRDDVVIAAAATEYYLVRTEAGATVTVTATGNGGADPVVGLLDREATPTRQVDVTAANGVETLVASVPSSGWLAFAVDAGLPGGTVDVSFNAAPPPYRIDTSPRTFVDACAAGTRILDNRDDTLAPVRNLTTFTSFDYFGTTVTGFRASSNGWITFNRAYNGSSYALITEAGDANSVVAPLTGDLITSVCVLESASELIVQWSGRTFGANVPVEMQAVFLAGSNEIHFVYGPGHQATPGALDEVGIENADGSYSLAAPSRVMASTAFRFIPN